MGLNQKGGVAAEVNSITANIEAQLNTKTKICKITKFKIMKTR